MQRVESKAFLLEGKKQETFAPYAADATADASGRARRAVQASGAEVLCFFFSKKKVLLPSPEHAA